MANETKLTKLHKLQRAVELDRAGFVWSQQAADVALADYYQDPRNGQLQRALVHAEKQLERTERNYQASVAALQAAARR